MGQDGTGITRGWVDVALRLGAVVAAFISFTSRHAGSAVDTDPASITNDGHPRRPAGRSHLITICLCLGLAAVIDAERDAIVAFGARGRSALITPLRRWAIYVGLAVGHGRSTAIGGA